MTVHEIYEESIRQLPIADRLLLVRLIMDDADPDEVATTTKAASIRFDALIKQAIDSGPAKPLAASNWDYIRGVVKKGSLGGQVNHNA